jgi:hypothetical protein
MDHVRRVFSPYGPFRTFEPQIDRETGGALGVVLIGFRTHEEAKKCFESEDGKRLGENLGGGFGIGVGTPGAQEKMRVTMDGQGKVLKALLQEIQDRKARAREEAKRAEREKAKAKELASRPPPPPPSLSTTAAVASAGAEPSPVPKPGTPLALGFASSSKTPASQARPSEPPTGRSTPIASSSTPRPSSTAPALPIASGSSSAPGIAGPSAAGSSLPPLPRMIHALPARPTVPAPIIIAVSSDRDITAAVRMGGDHPPGESTKPAASAASAASSAPVKKAGPSSTLLRARGTMGAASYYSRSYDHDHRRESSDRDRDRERDRHEHIAKIAGLPPRPESGATTPDARRGGRSSWTTGAGKGIDHWSPGRGRRRSRSRSRMDSRSRSRSRSDSRSWSRGRSYSRSRSWSRGRSYSRSRSRSRSWDRARDRSRSRSRDRDRERERERDRSGSRGFGKRRGSWKAAREIVLEELARNGMDHVKIDSRSQHVSGVREEDVREFFEGFQVDKVRFLLCLLGGEG